MSHPQPIDPGAVISRALEIYREQAGVLIPAALVVFAIQAIAVVGLGANAGLAALVSLVAMVLSTFYQGMVVELVRDVQDGRRDSSVGALFASITPVLITLVLTSIVLGIGVAIGLVLLLVPGLYLLTIWSVAAPVVVLERAGVFASLSRSHELVRGNGWPVFTVILVVFVGLAAVNILVGVLTADLGDVGSAVVGWLVNAATAPVTALTAAVLYLTLRGEAA